MIILSFYSEAFLVTPFYGVILSMALCAGLTAGNRSVEILSIKLVKFFYHVLDRLITALCEQSKTDKERVGTSSHLLTSVGVHLYFQPDRRSSL